MEHSVKQFRLELMQEAQTIWLTAADFSISEESENFIRYCHIQDGHDLSVEIRQRIQGAETLSTISVQHNGSGSVRSVQYPIEEYRELATFDHGGTTFPDHRKRSTMFPPVRLFVSIRITSATGRMKLSTFIPLSWPCST